MVSQDLAQFGVHGSSATGDIMYLICYDTSRDHLIKGVMSIDGWKPSRYVTTVRSLVTTDIVIVGI